MWPGPQGGGFPPLIERLQSDATRSLERVGALSTRRDGRIPSVAEGLLCPVETSSSASFPWLLGKRASFPACSCGKKLASAVLSVYAHSIGRDHEESSPSQDFALRLGNLISGLVVFVVYVVLAPNRPSTQEP